MTKSEIFYWREANRAHAAYSWRHGQIWGLLLVKVLNLLYTASQCAFISGLLRKLSVSIVKINCLSSFLCPLMQSHFKDLGGPRHNPNVKRNPISTSISQS